MATRATAEELLRILSEHSLELQERLGLDDAQFYMPTDGAGLRIRVAVRDKGAVRLPSEVDFELDQETVIVPIEVSEDFQDYQLH